MKKFLLNIIKRFLLRKHKFKTTDLIKTKNGASLFEVELMAYDSNLEPVLFVKMYPGGTKTYSISYPSILEYVEHKGIASGGMDIT